MALRAELLFLSFRGISLLLKCWRVVRLYSSSLARDRMAPKLLYTGSWTIVIAVEDDGKEQKRT